jgi:hypothetical protein
MKVEEIELWARSVVSNIDWHRDEENCRRQRETSLNCPLSPWRSDLKATTTTPDFLKRKRQHHHRHQPDPSAPTSHRARSPRRPVSLESAAFSASTRSSITSLSRGSNTSSPRKRLRALELAREPIRHRTLTRMAEDMPKDLADVCARLHRISTGIGVLGQSAQVSKSLSLLAWQPVYPSTSLPFCFPSPPPHSILQLHSLMSKH